MPPIDLNTGLVGCVAHQNLYRLSPLFVSDNGSYADNRKLFHTRNVDREFSKLVPTVSKSRKKQKNLERSGRAINELDSVFLE